MGRIYINAKIAEELLREIEEEEKHFYSRSGRSLKSLRELENFLRECAEEDFRHHVDGENNDFSNWIEDVIGDVELAKDLRQTREPETMADYILFRRELLKNRIEATRLTLQEKDARKARIREVLRERFLPAFEDTKNNRFVIIEYVKELLTR